MNRRDLLTLGASAAALPTGSVAQTAAGTAQAAWKPVLSDVHQNEIDTPGARAALVNRHLDRLLRDGPVEDQENFLAGLVWPDGFAIRKHGRPFVRYSEAGQVAMLEALGAGREPELRLGHRFFRMAKHLTAQIYYATEIGFRELNKGGRVPATFACCGSDHT